MINKNYYEDMLLKVEEWIGNNGAMNYEDFENEKESLLKSYEVSK